MADLFPEPMREAVIAALRSVTEVRRGERESDVQADAVLAALAPFFDEDVLTDYLNWRELGDKAPQHVRLVEREWRPR